MGRSWSIFSKILEKASKSWFLEVHFRLIFGFIFHDFHENGPTSTHPFSARSPRNWTKSDANARSGRDLAFVSLFVKIRDDLAEDGWVEVGAF